MTRSRAALWALLALSASGCAARGPEAEGSRSASHAVTGGAASAPEPAQADAAPPSASASPAAAPVGSAAPDPAKVPPPLTLIALQSGDISCRVVIRSSDGARHTFHGEFELCSSSPPGASGLVGQIVELTWRFDRVPAESCQGDPDCTASEAVSLVATIAAPAESPEIASARAWMAHLQARRPERAAAASGFPFVLVDQLSRKCRGAAAYDGAAALARPLACLIRDARARGILRGKLSFEVHAEPPPRPATVLEDDWALGPGFRRTDAHSFVTVFGADPELRGHVVYGLLAVRRADAGAVVDAATLVLALEDE